MFSVLFYFFGWFCYSVCLEGWSVLHPKVKGHYESPDGIIDKLIPHAMGFAWPAILPVMIMWLGAKYTVERLKIKYGRT